MNGSVLQHQLSSEMTSYTRCFRLVKRRIIFQNITVVYAHLEFRYPQMFMNFRIFGNEGGSHF